MKLVSSLYSAAVVMTLLINGFPAGVQGQPVAHTYPQEHPEELGRLLADSITVTFSQGSASHALVSVNGDLFGDNCDSVRILQLIFTWGSSFPPYQVPNLNWKAGRNQHVPQNFPLPPTAPGPPKDAHLVYVVYPDGVIRNLDIDTLIMGRAYALAPGCEPSEVGEYFRLPDAVVLSQNYPNPFNPSTVIRYEIPDRRHVELSIFNAFGQRVAILVSEEMNPGRYEIVWDGTIRVGQPAASGVYFYRLRAGDVIQARKLILLR